MTTATRHAGSPGRFGRWLVVVGLTGVALIWLLPYLWMVATSFKTLPEIVHAPT